MTSSPALRHTECTPILAPAPTSPPPDEATSALDSATEAGIMDSLKELATGEGGAHACTGFDAGWSGTYALLPGIVIARHYGQPQRGQG